MGRVLSLLSVLGNNTVRCRD